MLLSAWKLDWKTASPLVQTIRMNQIFGRWKFIRESPHWQLRQQIKSKTPSENAKVNTWIENGSGIDHRTFKGYSLLHVAARYNRPELVSDLIRAGADVNSQSKCGASPLHFAAQKCSLSAMRFLLSAPAVDVNIKTENGLTPLHYAAHDGQLEAVKTLVAAGADVNQQTTDGWTPLHFACQKCCKEVALWLINDGKADCSIRMKDGKTALHFASFVILVERLIESCIGLDIKDNEGQTALFMAAAGDHPKVVESLLKAGALLNLANDNGQTPFHIACSNNCSNVVAFLLKQRFNANANDKLGCSALHLAAEKGHSGIVDLLLTSGKCRVNSRDNQGRTPLFLASHRGQVKVVKLLTSSMKVRPDIQNNAGWTPLHAASDIGHTEVVEALLKANCSINLHNSTRSGVPLHYAAHRGFEQIVELLLDNGAEIDATASKEWTALHLACRLGRSSVVRLLMKSGANVNQNGRHGWTPLHVATRMGHTDIVRLLIDGGAKVQSQLDDGNAPLHFAAQNGHPEIIQMLLAADANPLQMAQNIDLTPIDLAATFNRPVSLKLMLQACTARGIDFREEKCFENVDRQRLNTVARLLSMEMQNITKEIRSQQLHNALVDAGFVRSRSITQAAMSNVLEDIIRSQSGQSVCLTGSYSEGWGSCLTRLDGHVDLDSDIDMTIFNKTLYHLGGYCKCTKLKEDPEDEQRKRQILERQQNTLTYSEGHVKFSGHSSNPVRTYHGSINRPAMDEASAFYCCSYPPIPVLHDPETSTSASTSSNIDTAYLKPLRQEALRGNSCHLVSAAPPGMEGRYIRVSTAILERKLARFFNDTQGQMYTILKYLTKRVINKEKRGLKSYHVKTLVFQMMHETPKEQWKPENLIRLTEVALNKLAKELEMSDENRKPHDCMRHFFLPDTVLQLHRNGPDRSEVAKQVRRVIANLNQELVAYMKTLHPLTSDKLIRFHPFMLMNSRSPQGTKSLPSTAPLEYFALHDHIRELLLTLSSGQTSDLYSLQSRVDVIPDFARTARESLRALAQLKHGETDSAKYTLHKLISSGHSVLRGLCVRDDAETVELEVEHVWNQLRNSDSAWKFCFHILPPTNPNLDFVSSRISEWVPLKLLDYDHYYGINFDVLSKSLFLELFPHESALGEKWFQELINGDLDVKGMLMIIEFCKNSDILLEVVHKHKGLVAVSKILQNKLIAKIKYTPDLQGCSKDKTLRNLIQEETLDDKCFKP